MAKRTYLQLVNLTLKKIKQSEVTDVSSLTFGSHSDMIAELYNDAQNVLLLEADWHTLLTERTTTYTASTATLAVASDFARSLAIADSTNNRLLSEGISKDFLLSDPNRSESGSPTHFAVEGSNYRFKPTPSSADTIIDVYWKEPTSLAANADTSDLPLICEPLMIKWVESEIFSFMGNSVRAELAMNRYKDWLPKAVESNQDVLDRIIIEDSGEYESGTDSRTRLQYPIS